MKPKILMTISLFLVVLAACSRPSGESGYVHPEGPYIVDAVTCQAISGTGMPVGVTDYFLQGDDINVWILWENYTDYHQVNVDWFKPNGTTYFSDSMIINGDGVVITYFTLHTGLSVTTGEWSVAISLDGEFQRSLNFYIDEQSSCLNYLFREMP